MESQSSMTVMEGLMECRWLGFILMTPTTCSTPSRGRKSCCSSPRSHTMTLATGDSPPPPLCSLLPAPCSYCQLSALLLLDFCCL